MYSLHGLDELIGPVFLQVCQRWMVSSYCTPGSPQTCVPSPMRRIRWAASACSTASPLVTARSA